MGDKYDGSIFRPPTPTRDDPAKAFEMMTSVEPWAEAVIREVEAWRESSPPPGASHALADNLLSLARVAKSDRPDTLIQLGYAWCQWRVMTRGHERTSGMGQAADKNLAVKNQGAPVTDEAVGLFESGIPYRKVAVMCGVSEAIAKRWRKDWKKLRQNE